MKNFQMIFDVSDGEKVSFHFLYTRFLFVSHRGTMNKIEGTRVFFLSNLQKERHLQINRSLVVCSYLLEN